MMEDNELLRDLLQELQDPQADGKVLRACIDGPAGFGDGFADRVTAATLEGEEAGMDVFLPRMFRWVAMLGAAAALALLVITWYSNRSIDSDAVAGISDLSIDDAFAANLFEK